MDTEPNPEPERDDPEPDDKDWTWVLDRVCPECGYDVRGLGRDDIGATIRSNVADWRSIMAADAASLSTREHAGRWSTSEYAAHVRDVYRLFHERLQLMLSDDDPLFANWDQDETARAQDYRSQDPAQVIAELGDAGARLADAFDAVRDHQWSRTGNRSDGARFTVETFARYLVHDPVHHVWDVTGST